jgi:hypothetical protein
VTVSNRGVGTEVVAVGLFDQTAGAWLSTGVVTVDAGKSTSLELAWKALNPLGTHTLVASAILPGGVQDEVPGNNEKTATFTVQRGLLTLSVAPGQTTYHLRDTVELKVDVREASSPVAAANVTMTVVSPRGYRIYNATIVTGADGTATVRLPHYPVSFGTGTCKVEATVARDGYETATIQTSFEVIR